MIKIWGRKSSSNTAKVLWCMAEMKLEYKLVNTGGSFGGNKEEPYASLNPNGRVPTIKDGNLVLWESNAIVRYLSAKYGDDHFFPNDIEIRADADRWMDWATTIIQPGTSRMFHSTKTPADEWSSATFIDLNPEQIRATDDGMIKNWLILNNALKEHAFIASDKLTIGDLPTGMQTHRWYLNDWFSLASDRTPLPYLDSWYARLCDRPEFSQIMASIPQSYKP
jgi:glutathione S-transferase